MRLFGEIWTLDTPSFHPIILSVAGGLAYLLGAVLAHSAFDAWPSMPVFSGFIHFWLGFVVGSFSLGFLATYAYLKRRLITPMTVVVGGYSIIVGYSTYQFLTAEIRREIGLYLFIYHFWSWPILLVALVSAGLVERFFSA